MTKKKPAKVWRFSNPVQLEDKGKWFRALNGSVESLESYFGNAQVYRQGNRVLTSYRGRNLEFKVQDEREIPRILSLIGENGQAELTSTYKRTGLRFVRELSQGEFDYYTAWQIPGLTWRLDKDKFERVGKKELPDTIELAEQEQGSGKVEKRKHFHFSGWPGIRSLRNSAIKLGLASYLAIAGLAAGFLTRDMVYYPANKPDFARIRAEQMAINVSEKSSDSEVIKAVENLNKNHILIDLNLSLADKRKFLTVYTRENSFMGKPFYFEAGLLKSFLFPTDFITEKYNFLVVSYLKFVGASRLAENNLFLNRAVIGNGDGGVLNKSEIVSMVHEMAHKRSRHLSKEEQFKRYKFVNGNPIHIPSQNLAPSNERDRINWMQYNHEEIYAQAYTDFIVAYINKFYKSPVTRVNEGVDSDRPIQSTINFLKYIHGSDFDKDLVRLKPGQVEVLYMPDLRRVWQDVKEERDTEQARTAKRLYLECLKSPYNVIKDVPYLAERIIDSAGIYMVYKFYQEDYVPLGFALAGLSLGAGLAGLGVYRGARGVYRGIRGENVERRTSRDENNKRYKDWVSRHGRK